MTAYQNNKVAQLKIYNNPFARGFRANGGHTKKKLSRKSTETMPCDKMNKRQRIEYTSDNTNIANTATTGEQVYPELQPNFPIMQQINDYTSWGINHHAAYNCSNSLDKSPQSQDVFTMLENLDAIDQGYLSSSPTIDQFSPCDNELKFTFL